MGAFEIKLKKKNKKWEHERNLRSEHWQVSRRRILAEQRRQLGIVKTENAKYAHESHVVKDLILKAQKALQRKQRATEALKELLAARELSTDVVGLQKFREKMQIEKANRTAGLQKKALIKSKLALLTARRALLT